MSEKSTLSAYWFRRKTRNFAAQAEVPKKCLFFSDEKSNFSLLKIFPREGLSSGPMAKTPPSNAGSTGLNPAQGTKTPHVMGCSKKVKNKKCKKPKPTPPPPPKNKQIKTLLRCPTCYFYFSEPLFYWLLPFSVSSSSLFLLDPSF